MMNAKKASEAHRNLVEGPRHSITKEEFGKKQEDILKEFRSFLEQEYAHRYYQEVLDIIWLQAKEESETRANFNRTTTNPNMFYQMELAYQRYEKFAGNIIGAVSPY